MRENFTYGSGRGVPRKGHPYRDFRPVDKAYAEVYDEERFW